MAKKTVLYFPGHYMGMGQYDPTAQNDWKDSEGARSLLSNKYKTTVLKKDGSDYLYTPYLTGVQVQVYWKDLEAAALPSGAGVNDAGNYAAGIALVQRALTALAHKDINLKLLIQIQDKTFNSLDFNPAPAYMATATYGSLATTGTTAAGNRVVGLGSHYQVLDDKGATVKMPRYWNANVATRFKRLLEAYGAALADNDAFAGIILPELHPIFAFKDTQDADDRDDKFIDNWMNIYTAATSAFHSNMVYHNQNHVPGLMPKAGSTTTTTRLTYAQLKPLLAQAIRSGIGFSSPDSFFLKNNVWEPAYDDKMAQYCRQVRSELGLAEGYYPQQQQSQQPSTSASTSFFGVETKDAKFAALKVGSRAKASGDLARAANSPLLAYGGEGNLFYAVDIVQAGMLVWNTTLRDTNTDADKGALRYWNDESILIALRRLGIEAGGKPPYHEAVPGSVVDRRNGSGQGGDFIAPKDLAIVGNELTWTWNGNADELKWFKVVSDQGRTIWLGKEMRAIELSALNQPGDTVTIQAIKNDLAGTSSQEIAFSFGEGEVNPPSKICVKTGTITWEFENDTGTPATGFNIYLGSTLVRACGELIRSCPMPTLGTAPYTISVRTVSAAGLSAPRSITFSSLTGTDVCKEEDIPADCTDIRSANATCALPKLEAAPSNLVAANSARKQNDFITALTGTTTYDLVFIGDSITFGWSEEKAPDGWARGLAEWNQSYSSNGVRQFNFASRSFNAGIGQETIQNVLWRVKGGKASNDRATSSMSNAYRYFATKKHKIAILCIGTNNLGNLGAGPDPTKVANAVDGIKAIANEIRTQSSDTKVLILGILPRSGANADAAAKAVNAGLASFYSNPAGVIKFLDLRAAFVVAGDAQNPALFGDQIHPNLNGYKIIGAALRQQLVGPGTWGALA